MGVYLHPFNDATNGEADPEGEQSAVLPPPEAVSVPSTTLASDAPRLRAMAEADFTGSGVTLHLSQEEWQFVTAAVSYALHGARPTDELFRDTLGLDPHDAERVREELALAAHIARAAGNDWSSPPD